MRLKQGCLMLSLTASTPLKTKYPARQNKLPGNSGYYPEESGLLHPVFQYQSRHPRKLPRIIRHQNGTDRDGVPGDGRVVRAD